MATTEETTKPRRKRVTEPVTIIAEPETKTEPAQVALEKTPDTMLAMSIDRGRSIEEIKELMIMRDKWRADVARTEFKKAKTVFQCEVPTLLKSKSVNFKLKDNKGEVNYKYADLGSIGEQIKGALSKSGLSYEWKIDDSGNKIKVTCIVSHYGGHEVHNTMEGNLDNSGYKNEIQQKASTITYLQRYTLIGALGLTTADTDNDAQGTKDPESEFQEDQEPRAKINEAAFKNIMSNLNSGKATLEEIKSNFQLSEDQLKTLEIIAKNKK